jgi:hypothetical protein
MFRTILVYGLTTFFVVISMMMNNQKLLDYFTGDLMIALFLALLAYISTFNKAEIIALLQLIRHKDLDFAQIQAVQRSIQNGWKYLYQTILALFLLQSINVLVHAGDKKAMQFLGTWLACILLGMLYLLLLRWSILLPLETSLKRRQILYQEKI